MNTDARLPFADASADGREAPPVMCGMVGLATCRGVLRFQSDTDGFYLWTSLFFRAGLSPFPIPWSDVTPGPIENTRLYPFVVLKTGAPHLATVRLMGISLEGTPMAPRNAPATLP